MRFVISGGTGLIGRQLVDRWGQDGHELIVLTRNPADREAPRGVRLVQWDAKTANGWGEWMDGADVAVNLAAESIGGGVIPSPWTDSRRRAIERSRLDAGEAMVAAIAAAAKKPSVLFQISGTDYYPYGTKVMTEEDAPGTHFLAHVVADYWEPSTAPVEQMGVRRVVGRLGPSLNLENGVLPASLLQFKLFAGGRLGSGEQWMPWIHLDDAVDAIQHLVEHEAAIGVYNLVAPNPVTNNEYTATLGKVMNRPTLIPVPEFAMRAALGEVADLALKGRRVSCEKLQSTGFEFKFPKLEPALRDLLDK